MEESGLLMKKKIAQLTQLVYSLNTQNEEFCWYLQAERGAYEREIKRIVLQANSIICSAEAEAEQVRADSNKQIHENARRNREELAEIEKAASGTVTAYKNEVHGLKLQIQTQLDIAQWIRVNTERRIDEVEEMLLAENFREVSEKCALLTQQKREMEERYRMMIENVCGRLWDTVQQNSLLYQEELKTKSAMWNQYIASYNRENSAMKKENENLLVRLSDLEVQIDRYKRDVATLETQVKTLKKGKRNTRIDNDNLPDIKRSLLSIKISLSYYKSYIEDSFSHLLLAMITEYTALPTALENQPSLQEVQQLHYKIKNLKGENGQLLEAAKYHSEQLMLAKNEANHTLSATVKYLKEHQTKRIETLKSLHNAKQEELAKALKKTSNEIPVLKEEIEKLRKEKSELQREWESFAIVQGQRTEEILEKLKTSHKNEIETIHSLHFSQREALLRQLGSERDQELDTVNEFYRKEAQFTVDLYETAINKIKTDAEGILSRTVASYEKKIKNMSFDHERIIFSKNKEISVSQEEKGNLLKENASLKVDSDDLLTEISAYQEKMYQKDIEVSTLQIKQVETNNNYQAKIREVNAEHDKKEEYLNYISKQERNELSMKHAEQVAQMQSEYREVIETLEETVANLQQNVSDVQGLYHRRPSRSEDVELIYQLKRDLYHKEETMKKNTEDLKFFKLELINRENNYNKIFGSTPNIGVLNPLLKRRVSVDKLTQKHNGKLHKSFIITKRKIK